MHSALIVSLDQLAPLLFCSEEVILAGEERQSQEGKVHESANGLVEVLVGRIIVAGGEHPICDLVAQCLEAIAVHIFIEGQFSHSVQRIDVDVLIVLGSAQRFLLNTVSAGECGWFFEGTDDVGDDVVAVVIGFIVGDELVT